MYNHACSFIFCFGVFCAAITCPAPSEPANGGISFTDNTGLTVTPDGTNRVPIGTVASYECTDGFSRVGEMTRTCTGDSSSSDGIFDGVEPVCSRKL